MFKKNKVLYLFMDLKVAIFKFLGSKWFILLVTLGMMCAMPMTYSGMKISWNWLAIIVFVVNLAAVGLGAYKFTSSIFQKKPEDKTW